MCGYYYVDERFEAGPYEILISINKLAKWVVLVTTGVCEILSRNIKENFCDQDFFVDKKASHPLLFHTALLPNPWLTQFVIFVILISLRWLKLAAFPQYMIIMLW